MFKENDLKKKNPVKNTREEITENSLDNLEYAYKSLDRVDSWLNNCDSKIAILLGFIGVEITVFITTGFLKEVLNLIKSIFKDIHNGQNLVCNFSAVILLFVGVIILVISWVKLYSAIVARIDDSKYDDPGLKKQSNLFFGSITTRSFMDLKRSVRDSKEKEQIDDVLSQVYISSSIAEVKFKNYNSGLRWTIIANIYFPALYVFISIVY